jgi:hypothetical protein
MFDLRDITWTCHICGDERPDAAISVRSHESEMHGIKWTQNIRYCNDRPECIEKSKTHRHVKVNPGA